jgi:RNA polymerase sigma-70 factor (ECF subfamily)
LKAQTQGAEEQLLVEAAQRDSSAFAELYQRNFNRLYVYVSRRTRTRDEAEDVTAEVFHRALSKLGSYEWRGVPFIAWLYRIAANLLSDRGIPVSMEPIESAEPADHAASSAIERRAMLFEVVGKLPPEQRRVVEMRFAEQKSIREIASELQRSEGAVKQLQFRALSKLRSALSGEAENA